MIVNKKTFKIFNYTSDIILLVIIFLIIFPNIGRSNYNYFVKYNLLLGLIVTWSFFSFRYGVYEEFRSRRFVAQAVSIIKSAIPIDIYFPVLFLIMKDFVLNRADILLFILFSNSVILIKYYIFKKLLVYLRKIGRNQRHAILIGAGTLGKSFYESVKKNPDYGYNIVGVLDDKCREFLDGEYLGQINSLDEMLSLKQIDDVVIALPNYAFNKLPDIIRINNKYGVRTRILPDYKKVISSNYEISIFDGNPILTLRKEPLDEVFDRAFKRLFDIAFSFVVILLVLSWISVLIHIANMFFSKGPLFFVQDRVGKKNKIFPCIKFRSMHVHCSENHASYKPTTKYDYRICRIGKFLRKFNIDELPQFINVFLGHMSIVGPRPHAIAWNQKYAEYVEEIRMRHRVKPGITGWAQIYGYRGDVCNEEENKKRTKKRIEFDLWYIENWSFLLDIQIIILTAWRMLKGDENAY